VLLFNPAEGLAHVAPHFSPALISPEAAARVMAAAELMPTATTWASLECRLSPHNERVDFSACIPARLRGQPEFPPSLAHPPAISGSTEQWARIASFWADWAEPTSPLHRKVPFVWLEFDLEQGTTGVAPPFLVFYLLPPRGSRSWKGDAKFAAAGPGLGRECGPVLLRAFSLLRGRPLETEFASCVATCLEEFPNDGYLAYAAPLTTRTPETFRLMLTFPKEEVLGYLRRIGWSGPMEQVEHFLAKLDGGARYTWFELDVAAGLLPTTGMGVGPLEGEGAYQPLLDWLTAQGACTPEKRDALLAWPGDSEVMLSQQRWPSRLQRGMTFKLVYRPGRQVEAKAYLELSRQFSLFM
jgi:hypothetical protein